MSNTIFGLIQLYAQPKGDSYDGLRIRTKSGAEHEGTLVHWKSNTSPNLICLTGDMGRKTFVDRDSIESVTVINPAR